MRDVRTKRIAGYKTVILEVPLILVQNLEKDSFGKFYVEVAAASLMIHISTNCSTCSCSKIIVERSGTVVAIFHNAILGWHWFAKRLICISRCRHYQKRQSWDDFHVFDSVCEMAKYLLSKRNFVVFIDEMQQSFGAKMEPEFECRDLCMLQWRNRTFIWYKAEIRKRLFHIISFIRTHDIFKLTSKRPLYMRTVNLAPKIST